MKSFTVVVLISLIAFFAGLMPVVGAPILGMETWDVPGNSLNGWLYTFGSQGFPVSEDEKIFASTNSSGGIFAGNQNYVGLDYGASFKFYADDFTTTSNTLAFFFYSETSGRTWKYSLNGLSTIDSWSDYYNIPMFWPVNWSLSGFGQAQFISDLADVDQVGIWIYHSNF